MLTKPDNEPWIKSTPGVMGGRPCIRGTRIDVEHVHAYHNGDGFTVEELCSDEWWDYVPREAMQAAN